jgi:aminomethyltransferase
VAWEKEGAPEDRDFIGRAALEAERARGPKQQRVGLVLEDKGVLRSHQKVLCNDTGEGEITSGGFGPTLGRSIALARVPVKMTPGSPCRVEIRGKLLHAKVAKPPFVLHGKVAV